MDSPETVNQEVMLVHGLGGWKSRLAIRSLVFLLNLRPRKPKIHVFSPKWQSNESAQDKLERLESYWIEKNKPTRLVGISAGANPVRYLAVRNSSEVSTVNLIAGYIGDGTDISDKHRKEAPAFADASELTHTQIQKTPEDSSKTTLHLPIFDDVIAEHNLIIQGVQQLQIPKEGHSQAIAWSLLHDLPKIAS